MALLMGLAFSALLGPLGTVAMLPLAGFAGAFGWVAVAALLTAGSPAGAGTTMTLHGSLFNLGAAAAGRSAGCCWLLPATARWPSACRTSASVRRCSPGAGGS